MTEAKHLLFTSATLLLLVSLAGCAKELETLAGGAKRSLGGTGAAPVPLQVKAPGLMGGLRASGGQGQMTGTAHGMAVSIAPTQTALVGTTKGMRVGISRAASQSR